MHINEILLEKNFDIETKNLYNTAIEFTDRIADMGFGKPDEIQNSYLTDGPVKKTNVVFDIVKYVDSFSKVVFSFSITGETHYAEKEKMPVLNIHMNIAFITDITEEGPVSEALIEYYLKSVYTKTRKRVEDDSNTLYTRILDIVQKMKISAVD